MNDTFTAIDFETAQGHRWSICRVVLDAFKNQLTNTLIIFLYDHSPPIRHSR